MIVMSLNPQWLTKPENVNVLVPKIWSQSVTRNVDGQLSIGSVTVSYLEKKFGTPLYVVDEADFKHRAKTFINSFRQAFASIGADVEVYYAGKAFLSTEVARWVAEAGLKIDTCSGGEMAVAFKAGIAGENIGLHGNNKSDAEILRALDNNLARIVVDSLSEIVTVAALAKQRKTRAKIMLRVTPGVHAHTHEFIATAHEDQKFGLSISSGAAEKAIALILSLPELEFLGLHAHIGSQIFDTSGFAVSAQRLLELHKKVQETYNIVLPELDLGGGFGIAYTECDYPKKIEHLAQELAQIVSQQCKKLDITVPRISLEPGRAIAGPTTFTLYKVGVVKMVDLEHGKRNYVAVDGGMSDNIRPVLYNANYSAVLASRSTKSPVVLSRVVGKHCESGDIVVRDVYLPEDIEKNDLLAVPATGAYCWSLANNYNYIPRPAVVAVKDGFARVIVRGENETDLLARDMG